MGKEIDSGREGVVLISIGNREDTISWWPYAYRKTDSGQEKPIVGNKNCASVISMAKSIVGKKNR